MTWSRRLVWAEHPWQSANIKHDSTWPRELTSCLRIGPLHYTMLGHYMRILAHGIRRLHDGFRVRGHLALYIFRISLDGSMGSVLISLGDCMTSLHALHKRQIHLLTGCACGLQQGGFARSKLRAKSVMDLWFARPGWLRTVARPDLVTCIRQQLYVINFIWLFDIWLW